MAEREIWGVDKIRNLFDLSGKTAIVTGGSGAFGHDAAKGLAAFGANVVVTSRRAETLEAAAKDIADATGAKVKAVSCDAVDPESVEAMVQRPSTSSARSTSSSPPPARPTATPPRSSPSTRGRWSWTRSSRAPTSAASPPAAR